MVNYWSNYRLPIILRVNSNLQYIIELELYIDV